MRHNTIAPRHRRSKQDNEILQQPPSAPKIKPPTTKRVWCLFLAAHTTRPKHPTISSISPHYSKEPVFSPPSKRFFVYLHVALFISYPQQQDGEQDPRHKRSANPADGTGYAGMDPRRPRFSDRFPDRLRENEYPGGGAGRPGGIDTV